MNACFKKWMRVEEEIACLRKKLWKVEKRFKRVKKRNEIRGLSGFLSEGVLRRFQLWLFAQGSPGIYQRED